MPKWSNFIRDLGTSGPPTLQGIYALGFALRSEIPALFAKYVRVDASQSFTDPEKLQGRENLGLGTISTQDADDVELTGGTILGLTDLGFSGGGAASARTNIGLGNVDNTSDANKPVSTATQTALNLKADLASPALTGNPTAPTASPGDNDTSLANTAFVANAVSINALTAKTTPVDADEFALADSAASFARKKITWANLKAAIWAFINGTYVTGATAYTPTFSASLGTVVNVEMFWRRVGPNLEADGRFTAGTVTNATVTIGLPAGLTIATARTNTFNCGNVGTSVNLAGSYCVLATGGASSVQIGVQSATAASLTAATASGAFGNGAVVSPKFSVPIQGWN